MLTSADLAHVRPWAPVIASVCGGQTGAPDTFDPFDFAAVGFRETGWTYGGGYAPKGDPFGYGDRGHGFGPMQIDSRSHAGAIREIRSHLSRGREDLALRRMLEVALGILVDARLNLIRCGEPLEKLRRATFDAYNAGAGRVCRAGDPDSVTTGRDYGTWVVACSDALKLAAPDLFAPKVIA